MDSLLKVSCSAKRQDPFRKVAKGAVSPTGTTAVVHHRMNAGQGIGGRAGEPSLAHRRERAPIVDVVTDERNLSEVRPCISQERVELGALVGNAQMEPSDRELGGPLDQA